MAYYYPQEKPDENTRLMDIDDLTGDFDDAMPRNTWVEFLNLEENHMFDKVQNEDKKARQVLSNSVIHMKAIYTFSNLCEIEAFVKREDEAARLMNDRNNPMQIRKYVGQKMNLAENFDPDYGPIPIPEIINGRQYFTFRFFVDLEKIYTDSKLYPMFKLAKTDTVARNRFKLQIRLHFVDGVLPEIFESPVFRFTDRDRKKMRKLERNFDVQIGMDQSIRYFNVRIKGHKADIPYIREEIHKGLKGITDRERKELFSEKQFQAAFGEQKSTEVLKDIKDESKVPTYWVKTTDERKYYKFKLFSDSQEYKDVEAAFRATAQNQIISIERIQNKEIYELYNVKRERMIKKYGSIAGKEKMLFHGTSVQNLDKINADGLNRIYAGAHAKKFGSGVYFARDAIYSSQEIFSPPDPQGLRYMYYAKVLVGDYTNGHKDMKVRPPKCSADPNETYDSVVNNVANPTVYVLFQDYEYYTEYLIAFK